MSEINSWEDLRRKVIDEEFSDVPMQSRNTSEFEINVNARVWENIRTELLSKLRGGGIQFAIKHHDIHRDTGYYAYDEKGSDGKGIYTIDMPDGLEFSNFENPFDERDLFARVYSLFHEYKHILQREGSIYNIQITPENMAFGRAGLIAQYFTEYDEANYANDPREIDAQIYGIEQAIKYIKENYPWVDIEKACVGFVKDFINGQKENGFPELSFTEETSGSIQEILNDLRKRMENPRRAKFSEIVLHDWYDEDEPEKKLRNKFNDDFIKKYEDCKSVEEKDEMLITAILEIYPEAIQEYPILQMRSKGEKTKMSVHEKIDDMKLDILDCEKKIEQLTGEIEELKKQGSSTYIQVLAKRLQISELEIDIIDTQGACDRLAKGEILKDLKEKKDGKQFLEHKYLSDCYRNNNELQRLMGVKERLYLKSRIMIANKEQNTQAYQDLQEEIKANQSAIAIAEKSLNAAVQLYSRQGGKQGTDIDFSVPYTDILEQYEKESGDVDLVQRPYDISQLVDTLSTRVFETNDWEKMVLQINKESTDIFTNNLNGTSKELAEIYGNIFTHYVAHGETMFEESSRMVELMLGTSALMPEEIIKRGDNKYVIVYTDEKGEYIGVPCSRNTESGVLEVIGGDGTIISSKKLAGIRERTEDKDKITFDQMEMQVVRHNVEKSLQDGTISEIVEISDTKMLQYLSEQNNLQRYSNLGILPKIYMISRQDKDGNSHYEFVAHNSSQGYTKLEGLQQVPNKQNAIVIDGTRIPGQPTPMQQVDCTFIDRDGNSYFAYHQFGKGMSLSYSEHQREGMDKVEVSKDSGLNRMLHNSRVRDLMRAGYNAMGIGYEKVKSIYSKYRGKQQENLVENTREN